MEVVPVNTIVIGENRQRREFNEEKIKKLAESIANGGLQNAIVLSDPETKRLVSGQRRLRAVSGLTVSFFHDGVSIPAGHIPVTYRHELSATALYEAELDENLWRENLTWKEQADAVARLHELRSGQAVAKGTTQTFTATARELKGGLDPNGHELGEVRDATLLKPFLNDPEVTKASSQREAMAIVRRKLAQEFREKLAKNFDASKTVSPHRLINEDLHTAMLTLDDAVFDCIITDPPYGIDAHKMAPMSSSSSGVKHEYEDTLENAKLIWTTIFSQGARVCKPAAHLYMFLDQRYWELVTDLARSFGWDTGTYPIIWHKPGGGHLGDHTRWPRRSYETILFARRGDKRVTGVYLDVAIFPEVTNAAQLHAAAKPVDLYTNLLRRSCIPGDKVLDPCTGSGPLFPAANRLRLIATGIEKSPTHYATALQRLNEA